MQGGNQTQMTTNEREGLPDFSQLSYPALGFAAQAEAGGYVDVNVCIRPDSYENGVVSSAQPAPLALAYRSGFNGVNSDQFRSSNGSRGYQPGSFIYNSLEWVSDSSAPLPNYAAFDTRAIGTDNTSSLAFLNNADYVCNIPMNFPTPLGTGVIDQQIQPSLTLPPPSYHGSFNATLWPHLPHYQHPVQQNLSNPQVQTYPCSDYTRSFGRKSDRDRHITSVHGTSQIFYLCPVVNCPKSQGKGYSRQDKVTEHLWKKHANLGFTKRV